MQVFRISKIARLAESCIIWTRGSIFAKYSLQKNERKLNLPIYQLSKEFYLYVEKNNGYFKNWK